MLTTETKVFVMILPFLKTDNEDDVLGHVCTMPDSFAPARK